MSSSVIHATQRIRTVNVNKPLNQHIKLTRERHFINHFRSSNAYKTMVTTKHCCWGNCKSDFSFDDKKDIFFIGFGNGFPKPHVDREKCLRWVQRCGRKHFTINNVNKDTYICSLHFVGGKGPTAEHPDPIKCGEAVSYVI